MRHLKKNIFAVLIFVILLNLGVGLSNVSFPVEESEQGHDFSYSSNYKNDSDIERYTATANSDELLGKYEKSSREFIKTQIGDKIVYFHQRMINEAIVEKDFIVYQFDKYTKELIEKIVHWRSGLPEYVFLRVSKEEAEFIVDGDFLFSKLYFISSESDVFPITPTPENPCWVVRSIRNGNIIITIIDAMDSTILGYGIPPPYNGFAFSGPQNQNPCSGSWNSWIQNAENWFNKMGYPTNAVKWPTKSEIKSHVQDPHTILFYEIAHGRSWYFVGGCSNGSYEYTYAEDIEEWISSYPKKLFVFLGSCDGMCYTDDDTFSYEFRKGTSINTTTVGYCGMSSEACDNCWTNSLRWQDQMFLYIYQGHPVKEAFDFAIADYPMCKDCMRFAGDDSSIIKISYYTLIINAGTGGTTEPPPGTYTYDNGTEVTIRAIPNTNYKFEEWSGDASGTTNPLTITMDSDKSITANFIQIIYAPLNSAGQKVLNRSLSQAEYINVLTWQANPNNVNIVKYKIYQVEGRSQTLLVELNANTFEYWHRRVEKDKQYTYVLVAVNDEGEEGDPAYITVQ